jgi:hypothetical protein
MEINVFEIGADQALAFGRETAMLLTCAKKNAKSGHPYFDHVILINTTIKDT